MLRWYAAILRILSPKILAVRAYILEVFRTGRERPIGMGTIPREITRTQRSRVVIWKQKWICHRFTLSFMHDTRCNLLQHNNYQTLGASLRLERRRWRDVLHLNNYGEDHEYEHIYSWICIHDPVPDWLVTSWICTCVMTQFSISWFFNEYAYVSWPLFYWFDPASLIYIMQISQRWQLTNFWTLLICELTEFHPLMTCFHQLNILFRKQ